MKIGPGIASHAVAGLPNTPGEAQGAGDDAEQAAKANDASKIDAARGSEVPRSAGSGDTLHEMAVHHKFGVFKDAVRNLNQNLEGATKPALPQPPPPPPPQKN